jgi:Flp pilus assembly protein TadG
MKPANRSQKRRGALAVEAAVVLPLLVIMMAGIWEVGRIVQVQQMLVNSAREGARLAAGGYTVNSTPVTQTMVRQAVRDYLRGVGLPAAAYNNAEVTLTCMAQPAWVDPHEAQPLDKFRLQVSIPAGAPFESTRWSFIPRLTGVNQMSASVDWVSLNNVEIVVDTNLPR